MTKEDTILSIRAHIGDPAFYAELIAVMRSLGHPAGRGETPSQQRLKHRLRETSRMFASGMPRKDVREALQERFGLSRRAANWTICQCFKLRRPGQ